MEGFLPSLYLTMQLVGLQGSFRQYFSMFRNWPYQPNLIKSKCFCTRRNYTNGVRITPSPILQPALLYLFSTWLSAASVVGRDRRQRRSSGWCQPGHPPRSGCVLGSLGSKGVRWRPGQISWLLLWTGVKTGYRWRDGPGWTPPPSTWRPGSSQSQLAGGRKDELMTVRERKKWTWTGSWNIIKHPAYFLIYGHGFKIM